MVSSRKWTPPTFWIPLLIYRLRWKKDSYPRWVTYRHFLALHLYRLLLGVQVDPVIHSFQVHQVDLHIHVHMNAHRNIVMISGFAYRPKDYQYLYDYTNNVGR